MKLITCSIPLFIISVSSAPPNYSGLFGDDFTKLFDGFNFEKEFNSLFKDPFDEFSNSFHGGLSNIDEIFKKAQDSFQDSFNQFQKQIDNISKLAKDSPNTDSVSESISKEFTTDPKTGKPEIKTHKEVHENGPHTHNAPVNEKEDTITDANTGELISSEMDNTTPESS
ncbi:hypothetical protein CONCODRAFT_165507 [Conidiobolus coronatus NRRL 28638]|uniref:Uncharacterized protein n=1 Tax=Conidiobolus coronatus (strain ATCC 28846 / CBS 209.66 / NRRL 28638) TaxID=796925 RepID=A0A137P3T5_CONC2|nr:hypothetical protein CONCODRAFT_165507 [Conidiobolus coronatus NRRL 28638]|eukprot:KXN69685.1 hypothetical protein CONCODRAFT_165507 [Conidiobolus coronatus NRRL 28638]